MASSITLFGSHCDDAATAIIDALVIGIRLGRVFRWDLRERRRHRGENPQMAKI